MKIPADRWDGFTIEELLVLGSALGRSDAGRIDTWNDLEGEVAFALQRRIGGVASVAENASRSTEPERAMRTSWKVEQASRTLRRAGR